MPPKPKTAARPKSAKKDESGPTLSKGRPGVGEPIDVDVEKHLKWLETGEGKPWPRASRS
jgi:hypothetical protein